MSLQTSLEVKISGQQSEALDLGGRVADILKKVSKTFADGSGADQANKIFQDSVSLAGGASQNFDLDAASILGPFGTALPAISKVRAVLIVAGAANPDDLKVAGDFVTTAVIDGVVDDVVSLLVKPGGLLLLMAPDVDGLAVTASTGDVLTVTNADGAVAATFDIIVLGS